MLQEGLICTENASVCLIGIVNEKTNLLSLFSSILMQTNFTLESKLFILIVPTKHTNILFARN